MVLREYRRNAARSERNNIGTRMERIGAFVYGLWIEKELTNQGNGEKEKSSRAFFRSYHAPMALNDMFAYSKAQPR